MLYQPLPLSEYYNYIRLVLYNLILNLYKDYYYYYYCTRIIIITTTVTKVKQVLLPTISITKITRKKERERESESHYYMYNCKPYSYDVMMYIINDIYRHNRLSINVYLLLMISINVYYKIPYLSRDLKVFIILFFALLLTNH